MDLRCAECGSYSIRLGYRAEIVKYQSGEDGFTWVEYDDTHEHSLESIECVDCGAQPRDEFDWDADKYQEQDEEGE